jgi:hypothetical protein
MLRMVVPNRSIADLSFFHISDLDFGAWTSTSLFTSLYTLYYHHHSYLYRTNADLDVVLPTSLLSSRFTYPSTRLHPSHYCLLALIRITLYATSFARIIKCISTWPPSCTSTSPVTSSYDYRHCACCPMAFDASTTRSWV